MDQALVQQIIVTFEEAYLEDIRNRITNPNNDIVVDVLTHLQDNCDQLITHDLLYCEDIVKKITSNTWDPISTLFSTIKELLNFSNIAETSYTRDQAINTA